MGNKVLFKPHPQCYKSSRHLTDLLYESGFDESDIQLICPSNDKMKLVCQMPVINCVSFTGGHEAAKLVSTNSSLKKQLFELGGNDALVVYPESDYKKAVKSIINQRFGCAGQRCTASKRVFIHEDCYEEVKNSLIEETRKLKIGDPSEKDTFIGPVVSMDSAKEIERRIQDAVNSGARILTGGSRDGAIIHPTILENANRQMDLIKNETFAQWFLYLVLRPLMI